MKAALSTLPAGRGSSKKAAAAALGLKPLLAGNADKYKVQMRHSQLKGSNQREAINSNNHAEGCTSTSRSAGACVAYITVLARKC